ncbi:MAG TPA: nitroreductase family protein [Abditibacteriaceae bacterium]|jgi:nitroreductase
MHNEVHADVADVRKADYPVDAAFLNRWSPRAYSPREVEEEKLMSVFEAARWAASSFNEQPWRFIIARSAEDRKRFVDFLAPPNQSWAKNAPVLVLVVSKKTFSHNGSPNKTYQFDAGAASAYLALGAQLNGLIAHGMAGFDADQARATTGLPTDFDPIAVFALGYHGDKSLLDEASAERELPSGRRPVSESIMEGHFVPAAEKAAEDDTENG